MRVISGTARGHKLVAPDGTTTRPTSDKIKESLFNILMPNILNCTFLDLYSGSGAIAIEALSRGASRAVLVENNKDACLAIKSNLTKTKFLENATLYANTASAAIDLLGQKKEVFDIVFMDPPYLLDEYKSIMNSLLLNKILKSGSLIIIEHGQKIEISIDLPFSKYRVKEFGKETAMSFFIYEEQL